MMNRAFKISAQGNASDVRVHGISLYTGGYDADSRTVLLLKLDEGFGSRAVDYSGNRNDGTITGGEWVQGKYGYGLKLDGINDKIVIPHNPTLNLNGSFCIEGWVKGEFDGTQALIAKKDSYYIEFSKHNNNKIKFRASIYKNGTEKKITSNGASKLNEWTHVAFQRSEDGHLSLVVNGVEDKVSDFTCGVPDMNENTLFIGCEDGDDHFFQGNIDEIRISNIYRSIPSLDPNI